jgi:hypothetical protein
MMAFTQRVDGKTVTAAASVLGAILVVAFSIGAWSQSLASKERADEDHDTIVKMKIELTLHIKDFEMRFEKMDSKVDRILERLP